MSKIDQVVADLAERVARLEAREPQPLQTVLDRTLEPPEQGRVVYSGLGPWADHAVVWQMERAWDDIVDHQPESIARTFAALSNPVRVRIIGALVDGPAPTAALAERIDAGTSGQLFHHLRDLLAAGLVHQPQRGIYALRAQHVLPLLAAMSAVMDLAAPSAAGAP
jgi:DNA-binding transcriptional ArsR family regulator